MSTARINRAFLAGAAASPEAEVLAVASRDRAAAERYAREHGIERAYGAYGEMLADPDLEAVYISLPNALHIEWATRALEAGKHVLCEKPLSRRADAVAGAFALAAERDRLLMEAFMYRHHPQTRRLESLVDDGAVGRLRMILATFSFNARDPGNVRLAPALDGGALMDVGCYCVNALRLLAGEPQRVSAARTLASGVDVTLAATLQFREDVLAHLDCGLVLAPRHQLEVVGEDGALFLADPWHCRRPVIELHRDGSSERIEIEPVDSYRLEVENFSRAVRGVEAPLLGREDAVGQARTIEALYAAADGGETIVLS
jgi:D-xylose 1-dehydrogenase (NADP+, D-xylono-1,5-lactone-forming)